ncbi:MAG: YHS domain-containing protein, partial [Nitrospirota bacterium]|nr:YHS domain-containing protein [Nitrospirota bacterium]
MAIDPICEMTVEPATAAGRFDYEGETYYFCSVHCRDRFRAAPNQYVKRAVAAGTALPTGGRRSLPMMQPPVGQPATDGELDPVCGMTVQPATAAGSHPVEGKTYYFCSTGCLEKFRAEPRRYLSPASSEQPAPAAPAPAGTKYVCPMC